MIALASMVPHGLAERLAPHVTLVRAKAGRSVVSVGTRSTNVYFVHEGRVQVTVISLGGRETVLRDLHPGALFGELSAIDDEPRSASIVAKTDCILGSVAGEVFRKQALAEPDSAEWLAKRLAQQVRALTEKLFELTTLRVAARLHCELLRLAEAEATGTISPFPTHGELAARIGTHREAVTRELRYLSDQRIVVPGAGRVAEIDLDALRALVRVASA